jgi:hypothetical protein
MEGRGVESGAKLPVLECATDTGRTSRLPLVTQTPIHIGLLKQRRVNSHSGEDAVALAADLCRNSYQAMQAILRKYSPGLMTAAIYTGILLFALLCTFAGR